MEIPKLLWLKRHLPSTYRSAGHFFDLADFLSFKATGSVARSMCTLTCKWNFLAHERRWSRSYFERVGLGDLAMGDYARIGQEIAAPGTALGAGLSKSAAYEPRLLEGTPVGASLIDAHAGGVGTIGGRAKSGQSVDVCRRLAYIMGTSACIMATTAEPCFVPGVWGPYYSGMVPGFWLNEGGQSAAGAAIDHLIGSHPAYKQAVEAARAAGLEVLDYLERRVVSRFAHPGERRVAGARHPRAAGISRQSLALRRSRFARDRRRAGSRRRYRLDGAAVRGGTVRAGLWPCGCRRRLPLARRRQRLDGDQRRRGAQFPGPPDHGGYHRPHRRASRDPEPVLLGAAMLGAVAGNVYGSIGEAMASMSAIGWSSEPTGTDVADFHQPSGASIG